MSLINIKRDIRKIKQDMGADTNPTIENFFKYCKQYYNRSVDMREIMFKEYEINNTKVKSNPVLFLQLSHQFFTEKNAVPNPIATGRYGLKWRYSLKYWEHYHWNEPYNNEKVMNNEDFSNWFDSCWKEFIRTGDLSAFDI